MKALGQLQPVGAKPDGTLLWGERRFRAAQLAGLKELSVIITDRPLSDSEIRLIQLTENMLRADLSGHEKWMACTELMAMNPGWQMKDLAGHLLGDDVGMLSRRRDGYRHGNAAFASWNNSPDASG
jgi:ParB/RepB/Spo0J family partition protein